MIIKTMEIVNHSLLHITSLLAVIRGSPLFGHCLFLTGCERGVKFRPRMYTEDRLNLYTRKPKVYWLQTFDQDKIIV